MKFIIIFLLTITALVSKGQYSNIKVGLVTSSYLHKSKAKKVNEDLIGKIYVTNGRITKIYNTAESIDAEADRYKLWHSAVKNNISYFLLEIKAWSKPHSNGNGYCGAGTEEGLLWIAIDKNCNILDSAVYITNSCFKNYYTEDDIKWIQNKYLEVKINSFNNNIEKTTAITYDKTKPEEGIKLKSSQEKIVN